MQLGRLHAVVLDIVLPGVRSIRYAGQDFAPVGVGALIEDGLEARFDGLATVSLEQFDHALRAHPAGGDLPIDIALQTMGQSGIAEDDFVGILVQPAGIVQLDGRHHQALLKDAGGVRRHASRNRPADIVVMPERLHKGDDFALEDHRHGGAEIRQMPDAAFGEIDIVMEVDIPLPHRLQRVIANDGVHHGAVRATGELSGQPIVQAGPEIVLVADHGRAAGALDCRLDLRLDRGQRPLHDLEGDRVDVGAEQPHTPRAATERHGPGSRMRFPYRSMRPCCPGWIAVVEPYSSTMAGPPIWLPGSRVSRP